VRSSVLAFAAACASLAPATAAAGPPGSSWLGVGPYGGALLLDEHLADYRWDVAPQAIWGLQGMLVRDRFGVGARVWRSGTTQDTSILGEASAADVRLTGAEILVEPRIASAWGTHLFASASGGLLHVGWSPDRLELDDFGTGVPIAVDLEPIDTWHGGLGLALRRALPGRVTLGLAVERSMFRLDTAHRAGEAIVEEKETFGNWTVRFELSQWFISI
jgi:hypothetical protein